MRKKNSQKTKPAVSRRQFLTVAAATATAAALSGCAVTAEVGGGGWLPTQYRSGGNWPAQVKGRVPLDPANISLIRDDQACILCGQCLEVCQNTQTVFNYYELPVADEFICIHCGQCSLWCPTGALRERRDIDRVTEAINDPDKLVIVQTAPSTRVGLGEEFGLADGAWVEGQQIAALRALGCDVVLDTNFTADLTIMEEGTELIHRLTTPGSVLPQFTSCCPGWVKFLEYYYPELIPNVSTAKSPQQMLGAMLKTYYAKKQGIDPSRIFSVSIMPCVAKKFECKRPEFNSAGQYHGDDDMRDVDVVLSVRELATMIKEAGINFDELPQSKYDSIMGEGSGAGVIFGNTGGVMEAAIRTAYAVVSGEEPPEVLFELTPVRGLEGIKEAALDVPGFGEVRVAIGSSLKSARELCERVKRGEADYHFIEIMTCPGGCIAGGGQPRTVVPPSDELRKKRTASLYQADSGMETKKRLSHKNTEVQAAYKDFLGEPCGELSEKLLHTTYTSRASSLVAKNGGEA